MARPREFDLDVFLDKAMEVFWTKGFSTTSMADIYVATGLGPGSVYAVVKDKDALFQAVFERYAASFRATMASELSGHDALSRWFEMQVEFLASDPARKGCLIANTIMERYAHTAETQRLVQARIAEIRAYFHRQIAAGQKTGTVGRSLDPEAAADALLGSVMGIMSLARGGAPAETLTRIGNSALAALQPMSPD